MAAIIPLGTFTRVPLRDAWPTEDGNFTPWLAHDSTIGLLGETLGMTLEVEAVEHWVGPFRADILARVPDEESDSEHRVIIENQFGRTNHGHLGQILTYLAGIENAKTVVWIAETIQPDHRAAVDWLNSNTTDEFSFFAIEIELWKIGDSMPAPRFNVIASPNDWTKSARRASNRVSEMAGGERKSFLLSYWTAFSEYMKQYGSKYFRPKRPRASNAIWFGVGRSGTVIVAIANAERSEIGVSLYTDKLAFGALSKARAAFDAAVGEGLDWQELPEQKRSRINLYKTGDNPADESRREEQYAWLLTKMEAFYKAFDSLRNTLPPRVSSEASDTEAADA
jgi:hypothetical protein